MFFLFVCLFADDDLKTDDLELYFRKVFQYERFCKKLNFGCCNLFIKNNLLERCLLERIKSLVGHLQFMVGQKNNLVRHLILPRVFAVGQNFRCVFRLVGLILILDRYLKAWSSIICSYLVHFSAQAQRRKKIRSEKISYTPGKWNFLTLILKKILDFRKWKPWKNFLYFLERKLSL